MASHALWEVKPSNDEMGYLAEEIFKQVVEGAVWLFLSVSRKIQEERNDLRKEFVIIRKEKFKD